MKKHPLFTSFLGMLATLFIASCSQQADTDTAAQVNPSESATVRVLTDRTETHLKPLFALFEDNTGIKVEAVYADDGMLTRLKTQPTEADLVISKTAETMEQARQDNLLQAFSSEVTEGLAKQFIDPDNMYVITSYRPRIIFHSKERVSPDELSTYIALTDPKWKGKIAIRSGYHPYNMSLFCQMMEAYGPEKTREFIAGLKANLARKPQANDRGQVQAIYEGKADVSIGNSYYMPLMLERDDQRAWGEAAEVFFPNQDEDGTFVMRSAAGLTTADRNVGDATNLLKFLLSDLAQTYFSKTLSVYTVKEGVPGSPANAKLAPNQKNVENGQFKANFVSVRNIAKHREAVTEILNELNFDG